MLFPAYALFTGNAFQINKSGEIITTLIDKFKYPKYGPGMMWETAYKKLEAKNHKILLSSRVIEISKENNTYKVKIESGEEFEAKNILSSMPLAHLPKTIKPIPDNKVLESGQNLKFRDFLSVALVIDKKEGKINIDWNDEIIKAVVLSHEGRIKLEQFI